MALALALALAPVLALAFAAGVSKARAASDPETGAIAAGGRNGNVRRAEGQDLLHQINESAVRLKKNIF